MENNSLSFDKLPAAVEEIYRKLEQIEELLKEKGPQEPSVSQDTLFNVEEAANFLNLTVPTIYSKVSRGELPVMKRSKRLYFSRLELLEYLRKGRKKTYDEIMEQAEDYTKKKGGNHGFKL